MFTEKERQDMFSKFWENLDWDQRKVYVSSLVLKSGVKRKTTDESKRKQTFRYTLWKNNEQQRICFSTLGLGEKTVYAWVMGSVNGMQECSSESGRKRSEPEVQIAKKF